MQWSNDERRRFVDIVDGVERAVVLFYRLVLVLIILTVVGFTAFVIVRQPFGAGNQGEWFYFGVAVLMILGWAMGQLFATGQRQAMPNAVLSFFSNRLPDGAHSWQLQLGAPPSGEGEANPAADVTRSILSQALEIPLAAVNRELLPDDTAISSIAYELDRGTSLEDACRYVQPRYDELSALQQRAFLLYVTRTLEQRGHDGQSAEAAPGM